MTYSDRFWMKVDFITHAVAFISQLSIIIRYEYNQTGLVQTLNAVPCFDVVLDLVWKNQCCCRREHYSGIRNRELQVFEGLIVNLIISVSIIKIFSTFRYISLQRYFTQHIRLKAKLGQGFKCFQAKQLARSGSESSLMFLNADNKNYRCRMISD